MLLVVAKTLLTPLLLVLCTVVSRRWGDAVGGWLLGLPMVSGPVSLFLAIQHGSSFAESAARSTLLGFVAVGVFCLVYLSLAENHGWKLSLTGSVAACMATVAAFAIVHLSLAETFVAVPLALLAIGALLGARSGSASAAEVRPVVAPSKRGIAARMALSGALVLALTTASGALGGTVSGLLAPLPILAALMAAAGHRREGAGAARGLLRGLATGLWGGVAFFGVVAALLGSSAVQPAEAYALAALAAAVAGWAATRVSAARPLLRLQKHPEHPSFAGPLHGLDCSRERIPLGDQLRRVDVATLKQAYCGRERAAA